MSYSISTLLTRNLHDVFGENDEARRRAAIDEIFTEDCVFMSRGAFIAAATRSIASPARSRRRTLTFNINPLPRPRNWAMAGESDGSRAVLGSHHHTQGQISSLLGTAGLPPSISFSTNCPEQKRRRRPGTRGVTLQSIIMNVQLPFNVIWKKGNSSPLLQKFLAQVQDSQQ
jgi:hypothetical protein